MKLNDITPKQFQCVGVGCPTVFETDENTYVIVGKVLSKDEISPELKSKLGPGETAIQIPKGLLSSLNA